MLTCSYFLLKGTPRYQPGSSLETCLICSIHPLRTSRGYVFFLSQAAVSQRSTVTAPPTSQWLLRIVALAAGIIVLACWHPSSLTDPRWAQSRLCKWQIQVNRIQEVSARTVDVRSVRQLWAVGQGPQQWPRKTLARKSFVSIRFEFLFLFLIWTVFEKSLELNPTISEIKKQHDNVEKWAKAEKTPFSITWKPFRPSIAKEPKGTVLIINPFNYPVWVNIVPLVRIHSSWKTRPSYLPIKRPALSLQDAPYFSNLRSKPQHVVVSWPN